jgi:hypothetical protein
LSETSTKIRIILDMLHTEEDALRPLEILSTVYGFSKIKSRCLFAYTASSITLQFMRITETKM